MNETTPPTQNISSPFSSSNSMEILENHLSIQIKRIVPPWGIGLISSSPVFFVLGVSLYYGLTVYRTRPSSYGKDQGDEGNGGGEDRIEGGREGAGRENTRGLCEEDEVVGTFNAHLRDGWYGQDMVTISATLVDKGPSKIEMSELRPFEG